MNLSKSFSGKCIELGDDNQKFSNFKLDSPVGKLPGNAFFSGSNPFDFGIGTFNDVQKEGIESFFSHTQPQEKFNIFNAFEENEMNALDNDNKEDPFLDFNMNFSKPSFKKPAQRRDSLESDKDSETASNTKDTALCGLKRLVAIENNLTETKTQTAERKGDASKKYFHEDLNVFSDLIPEKESLPSLNTLVSLSLDSEGGSLNVTADGNKLENHKLLSNFLNCADRSNLNDLLQTLKDCEAGLNSQLEKITQSKTQ